MEEAIITLMLRRDFLAQEQRVAARQLEKALADFDPEAAKQNAEPEPAEARGARLQIDLLAGKIGQIDAALLKLGYVETMGGPEDESYG